MWFLSKDTETKQHLNDRVNRIHLKLKPLKKIKSPDCDALFKNKGLHQKTHMISGHFKRTT